MWQWYWLHAYVGEHFSLVTKKCADDICLHAGDILGGQNGDFMLPKLNNRLVNRRLSRNSAFLLHFWKVHRILIGCRELLADGKAAWKLLVIFNNKTAFVKVAETSTWGLFSLKKSIALIRFILFMAWFFQPGSLANFLFKYCSDLKDSYQGLTTTPKVYKFGAGMNQWFLHTRSVVFYHWLNLTLS